MYQYTDFDRQFIRNRAAQYRDQLERNLAGTLGERFAALDAYAPPDMDDEGGDPLAWAFGSLGVQDRARRARSAGGIDDIGRPVGIAHRIGGGGQRLHRADVPGRDRGDGVGARDAVCRDGDPGGKVAGDAIDLGAGQLA